MLTWLVYAIAAVVMLAAIAAAILAGSRYASWLRFCGGSAMAGKGRYPGR